MKRSWSIGVFFLGIILITLTSCNRRVNISGYEKFAHYYEKVPPKKIENGENFYLPEEKFSPPVESSLKYQATRPTKIEKQTIFSNRINKSSSKIFLPEEKYLPEEKPSSLGSTEVETSNISIKRSSHPTLSYNFAGMSRVFDKNYVAKEFLSSVNIKEEEYRYGKMDILEIKIANHPEFSGRLTVDKRGYITIPLALDKIKAEGKTESVLKKDIAKVISKYVKNPPKVEIHLIRSEKKVYYVFGHGVENPGKVYMGDKVVTIKDAIIQATDDGNDIDQYAMITKVHVIHPHPTDPSYDVIDVENILYKGIMKDNIVIKPGDIIFIPSAIDYRINKFLRRILYDVGIIKKSQSTYDDARRKIIELNEDRKEEFRR